jgi:hypothetical protein
MPLPLAIAIYLTVLFGDWMLVRGRGHGWRLLVWYTLIFGPLGVLIWFLVRRGARIGAEQAKRASSD